MYLGIEYQYQISHLNNCETSGLTVIGMNKGLLDAVAQQRIDILERDLAVANSLIARLTGDIKVILSGGEVLPASGGVFTLTTYETKLVRDAFKAGFKCIATNKEYWRKRKQYIYKLNNTGV
ncbi:hypothetical protein S144_74 [Shewanella sp. phage 1/44]|uniref:hypothetical protein n=1 Tax=Shewanella sp. phage 1/44 TaxID=1458862 RepID=UPI0004F5E37A|nr:hypothetical protein S144_74 [Shewanella sp. phage 1/44]AHK11788.1 hypothetical protein S144_74 [Shewanella sp. phage 1/44]